MEQKQTVQQLNALECLRSKYTKAEVSGAQPPWPVDLVYMWCGIPETQQCRYTEDLRYSMRSVCENAPWIRNIYLVVQGDFGRPLWMKSLKESGTRRLKIVKMHDFIPMEFLPTYNWHVIQSWIWKIKSLSDRFIVMHDDMYIANPVHWQCFFTDKGLPINRHYPGPANHAVKPDHFIPYVRMWSHAIEEYGIQNTRVQMQATAFRKDLVAKYAQKYSREIRKSSTQRFIHGARDFDLLRFVTSITSTTKEAVVVKTDNYDWKEIKNNKGVQAVDYFVEADDVAGIKYIAKAKPKFVIINNSSPVYSHAYQMLDKLFPTASPFERNFQIV